jgi:anion-transporting  ArsA/GET3 family ATPase
VSLARIVERRLIIVTGKGGVGKTTVTAALALHFARAGRKVLAAEIVPHLETPSQLSLALGTSKPSEEPIEVLPLLWTVAVTPTAGHHRFLQESLPLKVLADAAMRSQALKKFLSAAPGFSDMGVMYRMLDLMKQRDAFGPAFDIVLLDSPATGHALALAQIPEFLIRVIPGGPIRRVAEEGLRVLTDPAITGTLIVTLPETLPVTEAIELHRGLGKHRLPVTAIVVNRVPQDPFSQAERSAIAQVLTKRSQTVLGERELKRIERAESALDVLKKQGFGANVALQEVDGVGKTATLNLVEFL